MPSEEWDEIKRIFASAIKQPASKLGGYLDLACGSRSQLRRFVDNLVKNHDSEATQYREEEAETCTRVFDDDQVVAGRFRIVRFIERGGMGEVYEVFDERLQKAIALKTVRSDLVNDRSILDRFRREIRISHEVAHDSICRVFDLIEHHTAESDRVIPCLSMELLQGESLGGYLQTARPLTAAVALPLIRQIAAALEVVHAKEIIHRDLKPSNIMLVPLIDGATRAVIMDFGLARPMQKSSDIFETRVEVRAGAPYFMAPELLANGLPSIQSDIYALGLVIDEMMTASRAFTAQSPHALLFQKLREHPIPPSKRNRDLPFGWERVILKCLASDPADRFSSIPEVVSALESPTQEFMEGLRVRFTRRKLALAAISVPVVAAAAVFTTIALKPLSATVIVFPVANLSNRKDYDYICKITDTELIRRFSSVHGLTAHAWYGPVPDPGQKLDARFLLDGRLVAVGSALQMVLTLTDNVDGQVIWTHEFDPLQRPASLDLQTEISERVLAVIDRYSVYGSDERAVSRVAAPFVAPVRRLLGTEPPPIPGTTTRDLEAWDHYSRANQLLDEDTRGSVRAGIGLLKTATDKDPNFALAYAGLSRAYIRIWGDDRLHPDALTEAENYAFKSVACDRLLPEPHVFLAAVNQNRWEWADSTIKFTRALELRPRFPQALRWFAGLLVQSGDFRKGLSCSASAVDIDPYGAANYLCHGLYLYYARQFNTSIKTLKTSVYGSRQANQENLAIVYSWLGSVSKGSDRDGWFQLALQKVADIERDEGQDAGSQSDGAVPLVSDHLKARIYTLSGDVEKAAPFLGLLDRSIENEGTKSAGVARYYAVLGDKKRALEYLERAFVGKDTDLMFIKVDPLFDSLRGEYRFQQIVRGMKLA